MRLQANYSGAWRSVAIPPDTEVDASLPHDEVLKSLSDRLCEGARGRRILDEALVIWIWSEKDGWKRPHWIKDRE